MYEKLKEEVLEANLELYKKGLAIYTFGNVSAVNAERSAVAIKPSGVDYERMTPNDIVIVDLNGNVLEGTRSPSSDTPTHLFIYNFCGRINAIAHTHSRWATVWAQTGKPITGFGKTHADYFHGDIPCTRRLTDSEIAGEYERETGKAIIEVFGKENIDYAEMPAVLVNSHGPFTWGADAQEAVFHSFMLEEVARLAYGAYTLRPTTPRMDQALLDRHYYRKHGNSATYGQKN